MFRYCIIESVHPIADQASTLINFFEEMMHIDHIDTYPRSLIVYYRGDTKIKLSDVIVNLSSDTLSDIRLFESYRFKTISERNKNMALIQGLLEKIPVSKQTYLNEHDILSLLIHHIDDTFPPCFLKAYASDQMMLYSVKVYLESNQNTSYAAKQLFIHRNTLIQRIDKFIDMTGFDIREFVPGYLIYSLLIRN